MKSNLKLPKEYYLEEIANYDINDIKEKINMSFMYINNKIVPPIRIVRFDNYEHQEIFNDIYYFILDKNSSDIPNDLISLMDEAGFFD